MSSIRHINGTVQDFFSPLLDCTAALPVLRDTVGLVEPFMARQHFLFHTAMDALYFCHVHPHLLDRPGTNLFTVIGLRPAAGQILGFRNRFPNARTVGVFDDDLCGRVLDCKIALWQIRRDTAFILEDYDIVFTWKGSTFRIPSVCFSLHRFRMDTGLRSTYRTVNGAVSFAAMVAESIADGTNRLK
jgi:hypothetical protein